MLAQLQEALAAQGRAALGGLGGVGKSQTAVEYAHRYLEEYDYVLWVAAQSREELVSGYSTIAGLLKLPLADAKDQTLAVGAIQRWLASHERWLLILDNADDLAMAREFMPSGKNGHVLVTTRARAVGAVARLVDVQEMGTDEGALFLLRRSKYIAEDASLDAAAEADQASAKQITTQLDGLPLALDQAAAYIEETSCGLSDYLELYLKHAPELLRRRGLLASNHPPVATTWALSFENIEKANPAAAELLKFCSFLHPDAIPEELFREGAPELGPELGAVVSDALALNGAISEILKYSLLRRDPNAHIVEIHRLVQAVLKQGMDKNTQRLWGERAVRAANCAFPNVKFSNWPLCDRLLPHAHECAKLINKWDFQFAEAAQLLAKTRMYLFDRARYTEAETMNKQGLTVQERALGPEHPDVAKQLNYLAVLYGRQGRHAKAEALFGRVLAIQEKALGPDHPDVAWSLNSLGALYSRQGRHGEAECLHKRALAIREKTLEPEHPDIAWSLNSLGAVYDRQSRYAEAEPLFKRALAIREKAFGPDHPDVSWSLNLLAELYGHIGRYEKAEPLFKRALVIREKALGPEHPDVVTSLETYALLLRDMGRPDEASMLESRARAIRAKRT